MHPKTYDVQQFETDEAAKAAGYDIPVPTEDVERVGGMNRKERRAWAAQQKRDARKRK